VTIATQDTYVFIGVKYQKIVDQIK